MLLVRDNEGGEEGESGGEKANYTKVNYTRAILDDPNCNFPEAGDV